MSQSTKLNLYTGLIIIFGLLIFSTGLIQLFATKSYQYILYFVAIAIISESFIIQTAEDKFISAGYAVGLASSLLFIPSLSGFIVFLGELLKVYKENGVYYHLFNSSLYKRAFNASAYALGAFASADLYHQLKEAIAYDQFWGISLSGVIIALIAYGGINIIIFSVLYTILDRCPLKQVFKEMKWIVSNFLVMAPIAVAMALAYEKSGLTMVALILGPLIMLRYSFKLYIDMKQQYFETIKTLSNALDAKDNYTNGHSLRVAEISVAIASEMKMNAKQMETIKAAALLHDIGKIGIADAIINKPGRLEMSEIYEIRRHPEIGETILKDVRALKHIAVIVKHHHERFDGNGYPDSLKGDEIPIESAIISVADAYDAMTSNRIYRMAMTFERAVGIIREERGRQFNPEVVDAFLKRTEEFERYETQEEKSDIVC